MANKQAKSIDPAEVQNQRILAQRHKRIVDKEVEETLDLGLKIEEKEPETAAELLRDEWDKKAFGDAPKLTTRVVFGPDPIVNNCPEFHEKLEKWGLEKVASAFRELILKKGELAAFDAVMRKGLRASIKKFGAELTAKAFYDRVMQIPYRTVEVEIDNGAALDPLLANPMRAAVERYSRPEWSVKFLSSRCMDVLGMRGYQIIKDEKGDPVKIGTLFMGYIPREWAEARQRHFAEESKSSVREQEAAFADAAERQIKSEGARAIGAELLKPGEIVRANSAINDDWLDQERPTGVQFG